MKSDEMRRDETRAAFESLFGGVAWMVSTRADVAVYVQALQRRGSGPRVVDCRRLNLVLRYLKRQLVGIRYAHVPAPHRLVGLYESAFRS